MEDKNKIKSVSELIEQIGRAAIVSELGHTQQVVSRAITEQIMPAHWYVGVRDMCERRGFTVSESLFKWARKSPSTTQNAKLETVCQGMGNNTFTKEQAQ